MTATALPSTTRAVVPNVRLSPIYCRRYDERGDYCQSHNAPQPARAIRVGTAVVVKYVEISWGPFYFTGRRRRRRRSASLCPTADWLLFTGTQESLVCCCCCFSLPPISPSTTRFNSNNNRACQSRSSVRPIHPAFASCCGDPPHSQLLRRVLPYLQYACTGRTERKVFG